MPVPLAIVLAALTPAWGAVNARVAVPVVRAAGGGHVVALPATQPALTPSLNTRFDAPRFAASPVAFAPAAVLSLAPAPADAPVARAATFLPAADAAREPGVAPRLITTLAEPLPEAEAGTSGESAAASERDFMARAQLGGAVSVGPALTFVAPAANPAPSGLVKAAPAAPARRPATAQVLAFGGVDHSGQVMRAALSRLAALPAGEIMELDFAPGPKSLRVLSELDHEVFLFRDRASGRWRMAAGDRHGVSGDWGDYDVAIHNHPHATLGAYSIYSDHPSPTDLETSRGKDARFMVVSRDGVVEWNSDMAEDAAEKLGSTFFGRMVMRITFPSLYPALLARNQIAVKSTSWRRFNQAMLDTHERPINERILTETLIPRWVAAELPLVAAKLGRPLDAAHAADVLKRTVGYRLYWHSAWTYKDHPDGQGIPNGHFRKDFGIRLMITPGWRSLKDLETHYRVLFAHEYTHWLQSEGYVSARGGAEAEAVAVEFLRAIELAGLPAVEAGVTGTIFDNQLRHFADGRAGVSGAWPATGLYTRGALAGAAYQVAQDAGRPEAAWEFLRLVTAPDGALEPHAARDRVLGRRP